MNLASCLEFILSYSVVFEEHSRILHYGVVDPLSPPAPAAPT